MKLKKKNKTSQGGIEFGSLWDNYKTQDTSKEGIYVYVIYSVNALRKVWKKSHLHFSREGSSSGAEPQGEGPEGTQATSARTTHIYELLL